VDFSPNSPPTWREFSFFLLPLLEGVRERGKKKSLRKYDF